MRFEASPDAAAAVLVAKDVVAQALEAVQRIDEDQKNLTYEDDFGDKLLLPSALTGDLVLARSLDVIAAAEGIALAFGDEETTVFRIGDLGWATENLRAISSDLAVVDPVTVELPHDDRVAHIQSAVLRAVARASGVAFEAIQTSGALKLRGSDLLDDQQRAAVDAPASEDLLVNAGAGSGKTHMLSMRIARLVAERVVSADRCVVLTYSRAAREQIQDRLNSFALAEYPALVGIDVRTLHSFGRRILQLASSAGKTRVRPGFQVVTEGRRRLADGKVVWAPSLFIEQYDRLFDGVDDQRSERARLALYPHAIDVLRMGHPALGVVSKASDLRLSGVVAVLDPRSGSLTELDAPELARVWTRYEELLATHNAIDFPGMVTEALEAIRKHPGLAAVAAAPYEHIFVDEFQDTSLAQNDLLFELAAQGSVLSCVGDGDQTIYSFAGADAQGITQFAQRLRVRTGRDAAVMPLENNYRSLPPIVAVAESVIARNIERLSKTMHAVRVNDGPSSLLTAADGPLRYTAPWLALQVRQMLDSGIEPSEIAVLFRKEGVRSPQESTVIQHLEKLAIPITTEPDDREGVRVLSIHQGKGSEFSHVLVLHLGQGHFPDERGDREEERRLLYVALTRAKDSLVVAGEAGADPDLFLEFLNGHPGINRVSLGSLSDVLVLSLIDEEVTDLTNMGELDPALLDWDEPEAS